MLFFVRRQIKLHWPEATRKTSSMILFCILDSHDGLTTMENLIILLGDYDDAPHYCLSSYYSSEPVVTKLMLM